MTFYFFKISNLLSLHNGMYLSLTTEGKIHSSHTICIVKSVHDIIKRMKCMTLCTVRERKTVLQSPPPAQHHTL